MILGACTGRQLDIIISCFTGYYDDGGLYIDDMHTVGANPLANHPWLFSRLRDSALFYKRMDFQFGNTWGHRPNFGSIWSPRCRSHTTISSCMRRVFSSAHTFMTTIYMAWAANKNWCKFYSLSNGAYPESWITFTCCVLQECIAGTDKSKTSDIRAFRVVCDILKFIWSTLLGLSRFDSFQDDAKALLVSPLRYGGLAPRCGQLKPLRVLKLLRILKAMQLLG